MQAFVSFDLVVSVKRPVSKLEVNRALAELDAPLAVEDEPQPSSGYFFLHFRGSGVEADEGDQAGGFELYSGGEEDAPGEVTYMLSAGRGDDTALAWIFALALAHAGGGRVSDPQSGREHAGSKLELLRTRIARYRSKIARDRERLPDAEKASRTRRAGETVRVFKERLFLGRASAEEQQQYLRAELAKALGAGDEGEVARLVDVIPAQEALLEAGLDPCFRAGRRDVAERFARRFPGESVRAHFVASAGFVGMFASPYVEFLGEALAALLDAETVARATARAGSPEMRAVLARMGGAPKTA
jgi:hypothetical protein